MVIDALLSIASLIAVVFAATSDTRTNNGRLSSTGRWTILVGAIVLVLSLAKNFVEARENEQRAAQLTDLSRGMEQLHSDFLARLDELREHSMPSYSVMDYNPDPMVGDQSNTAAVAAASADQLASAGEVGEEVIEAKSNAEPEVKADSVGKSRGQILSELSKLPEFATQSADYRDIPLGPSKSEVEIIDTIEREFIRKLGELEGKLQSLER